MTLDAESSGKTLSLVTEQGRFFHRDLGHAIEILDHTHTCCFHRLDVPQDAFEIAIGFGLHRRHAELMHVDVRYLQLSVSGQLTEARAPFAFVIPLAEPAGRYARQLAPV